MAEIGYSIGDTRDLGTSIRTMVNAMINSTINAPFLAEVILVNENKVDVQALDIWTFNDAPQPAIIFTDVLVGYPWTSKVIVNNPVQIGDIGLCIPLDKDVTNYKDTGKGGIPASNRRFNKNDSIFLPLSMFKQENMEQDYTWTFYGAPEQPTLALIVTENNTISLQAGSEGAAFKLDIDEDGNLVYDLADSSVNIELNKDDGITIKDANNNEIKINSDGIAITDANNNKTELTSDGIVATDSNNNKIEMASSGITVQDANNNKIEMGSSGITMQDAAGNKIETSSSGLVMQGSSGNKIEIGAAQVAINGTALTILP